MVGKDSSNASPAQSEEGPPKPPTFEAALCPVPGSLPVAAAAAAASPPGWALNGLRGRGRGDPMGAATTPPVCVCVCS